MKTSHSSRQAGFGAVEALLIIIVIGLAGTLGWVAYSRLVSKPGDDTANVQTKSGVADLQKPVEIQTSDDLNKASVDIDQVDINDDSTLSDAENAINELN